MKSKQTHGVTEWFPQTVKPARAGLYEVKPWSKGTAFSYWNGRRWGFRCQFKSTAFQYKHEEALGSIGKWRGLSSKP
jgi:hypothetical protein